MNYIKFNIASGDNISVNSSGNYYAEEEWHCSGNSCNQKFYFIKPDTNFPSEMILYRSDNLSKNAATRFDVRAYQITGAQLAAILDAGSQSNAYETHYYEGPVSNPNWSADKDPW